MVDVVVVAVVEVEMERVVEVVVVAVDVDGHAVKIIVFVAETLAKVAVTSKLPTADDATSAYALPLRSVLVWDGLTLAVTVFAVKLTVAPVSGVPKSITVAAS